MPKNSELSVDVRQEIVSKFECGVTVRELGNQLKLPKSTIYYNITKYKKKTKV